LLNLSQLDSMTSEGFANENARSRGGATMLCSIRRAAS